MPRLVVLAAQIGEFKMFLSHIAEGLPSTIWSIREEN